MKFQLVAVFALALAGCATSPSVVETAKIPVVQNSELPPPTGADLVTSNRPYLIGPFDKLSIQVFGVQDLNQTEIQADSNGQIEIPLAGSLSAAGMAPSELAREIERRLRQYIKSPQVAVNLLETNSQVITVDGQVGKPGLYPVVGRTTLMRAVATAGGATEFAKLKEVVVFRTADSKRYAGLYDLGAIRAGAYDDPEVFANDIVVVGDSQSRRIFKDFLQILPALTSPLIVLLTN